MGLASEAAYEEVVHKGCGLLEQIDLLLIVRELALLEEVAVLCASNPNHTTAVYLFPPLSPLLCAFTRLSPLPYWNAADCCVLG